MAYTMSLYASSEISSPYCPYIKSDKEEYSPSNSLSESSTTLAIVSFGEYESIE